MRRRRLEDPLPDCWAILGRLLRHGAAQVTLFAMSLLGLLIGVLGLSGIAEDILPRSAWALVLAGGLAFYAGLLWRGSYMEIRKLESRWLDPVVRFQNACEALARDASEDGQVRREPNLYQEWRGTVDRLIESSFEAIHWKDQKWRFHCAAFNSKALKGHAGIEADNIDASIDSAVAWLRMTAKRVQMSPALLRPTHATIVNP